MQVTREMMRRPRLVVGKIDALLREGGYAGPAPEFGETWEALFRPLHRLVTHRRRR